MKKYKEWLTNEIEIMESETSENYPHEQMVEREVVLNLINQLDEPEALSQKWIDNNKEPFHHFESKKVDYYVSTDFLQNLLIPKQELPVIPKYVAKYLEFAKKEASLIQVMVIVSEGWSTMKKEFDWISENDEIFARAWSDGYEVEEEQKYYVSARAEECSGFWFLSKNNNGDISVGTNKSYFEADWDTLKLTEQEIKDYDERYCPFAIPVEEVE